MFDYINLNQKLKNEIDEFSKRYSLSELFKKYGKLFQVGSYVYDLMVWRDYDLVLEMGELDENTVYSLIKDIGLVLNPEELRILNNLDKHNKNRPQGFWVGIYIDKWKIDLWLMDGNNAKQEIAKTQELKKMLKDVDKSELNNLKAKLAKNPDYHRKFSSVDLYNGYVHGQVRTVEEFFKWLQDKP